MWKEPFYRNLFAEGTTATGYGTAIALDGRYTKAVIQAVSSGIATVHGSVDGTNYAVLALTGSTGGTSTGMPASENKLIYAVDVTGMKYLRVNVTTATQSTVGNTYPVALIAE